MFSVVIWTTLNEILAAEGSHREQLVEDFVTDLCEDKTDNPEGLGELMDFLTFVEDTRKDAVPEKREVLAEIHDSLSRRILN